MTSPATDHAVTELGRRSRLLRLADSRGIVAGIALDHRDSFQSWLERRGIRGLPADDLREIKVRLARTLAPGATAIMLDAELGGRAIAEGVVPASTGLIMPLEAQGYEAGGDDRRTVLMADFSPADAIRWGADACKLLVPYRPDLEVAERQDEVIAVAVARCHAVGLPLVVEPVVYRRSTEDATAHAAAWSTLVVSAVLRIVGLGVDMLKLPFPILTQAASDAVDEERARDACARVDRACQGVPWVLLGAGAEPAAFADQLRLAGEAGASGFLAGRGIWGPTLDRDPDEVERRAARLARPELSRCRRIAERFARPLAAAA